MRSYSSLHFHGETGKSVMVAKQCSRCLPKNSYLRVGSLWGRAGHRGQLHEEEKEKEEENLIIIESSNY